MGFYIFTYLCIAVFTAAAVRLVYRQLSLPLHVRWEIYPVQHETAARAVYGGSYMEKADWWKDKYKISRVSELSYMIPEILLIRGLWKENKSLWRISFPFHLGLYLMTASAALLLVYAMLSLWGGTAFASGSILKMTLDGLIPVIGWIGMIAGLSGGLGLLHRRLTDRELRSYATFADYFNLVLIVSFFLFALMTSLAGDPFWEGAKAYFYGLLTAGASMTGYTPGQSLFGMLTILLASFLIAYIPLTHMSHMFMKYFLYHNVKWDDAPNMPGSSIESAVVRNLKFKPTWKATHIGADGEKSWRDIASSAPGEKK